MVNPYEELKLFKLGVGNVTTTVSNFVMTRKLQIVKLELLSSAILLTVLSQARMQSAFLMHGKAG